jgi:hypothetical protein
MSAVVDDETIRRADWIVGRSRIAAIIDLVIRRSAASVPPSRSLTVVRRGLREFGSLSAAAQMRCALVGGAAALSGHIVLAAMLPTAATPTTALTAVLLLGVCLAAAAARRR